MDAYRNEYGTDNTWKVWFSEKYKYDIVYYGINDKNEFCVLFKKWVIVFNDKGDILNKVQVQKEMDSICGFWVDRLTGCFCFRSSYRFIIEDNKGKVIGDFINLDVDDQLEFNDGYLFSAKSGKIYFTVQNGTNAKPRSLTTEMGNVKDYYLKRIENIDGFLIFNAEFIDAHENMFFIYLKEIDAGDEINGDIISEGLLCKYSRKMDLLSVIRLSDDKFKAIGVNPFHVVLNPATSEIFNLEHNLDGGYRAVKWTPPNEKPNNTPNVIHHKNSDASKFFEKVVQ